jgi:hypothetical protein
MCEGNLVPLLVPLCTVISFLLVRLDAMWITGLNNSFYYCYATWCEAVQGDALEPQKGLKIRRPLPVVGVQVPLRAPENVI